MFLVNQRARWEPTQTHEEHATYHIGSIRTQDQTSPEGVRHIFNKLHIAFASFLNILEQ